MDASSRRLIYLNHGSFGRCPAVVLEYCEGLRREMCASPMRFLVRELGGRMQQARQRLAALVGCGADDLALVQNSTAAMNIVAASLPLEPGDEVLCNAHEYGAVRRIWQRACEERGARLIVTPRIRTLTPETAVDDLLSQMTQRTRLVVMSHVTSPTAIVFPVEEVCRRAREAGVRVCIDGPHAVAMRPLALSSLGCNYYTASCHKWLNAPPGSGFLYVRPELQSEIRPAAMSWGRPWPGQPESWRDELEWSGTRDFTPLLAVGRAIDYLEEQGGLESFRSQTHDLAQRARQRLLELTGSQPLTPDSPQWYGSMVAVPLPAGDAESLQHRLWEQHGIEIPVIAWQDQRLIRVSCHLYNSQEDIDALVKALRQEL